MLRRPIARSPDLKKLQDEGYDLDIINGYLVINQVPYLNEQKAVMRGKLILSLGDAAGDVAIQPVDHTAMLDGEFPCHADGSHIDQMVIGQPNTTIGNGVVGRQHFSAKPKPADHYDGFYHQVTTYVAILGGPARTVDPNATAIVWPVIPVENENAVFEYEDTASSRADIVALSQKLALGRVALIGVGGTGSYVLDLLAKTPVHEIHIFDGDTFYQHNAFRSPGAASREQLVEKPLKVDYLEAIYRNMRRGIVKHPYNVTREVMPELASMDFVFLCMEGEAKKTVFSMLEELGLSFIDVGMGLYVSENGLGGLVRTTTSTPDMRSHVYDNGRVKFGAAGPNNEYDKNIQIACLNMFNAAQAVLKWQKLVGFFADLGHEHNSVLQIVTNEVDNQDKSS